MPLIQSWCYSFSCTCRVPKVLIWYNFDMFGLNSFFPPRDSMMVKTWTVQHATQYWAYLLNSELTVTWVRWSVPRGRIVCCLFVTAEGSIVTYWSNKSSLEKKRSGIHLSSNVVVALLCMMGVLHRHHTLYASQFIFTVYYIVHPSFYIASIAFTFLCCCNKVQSWNAPSVGFGFKDHLQAILIFLEGDIMHEDINSFRCTSRPVSQALPD